MIEGGIPYTSLSPFFHFSFLFLVQNDLCRRLRTLYRVLQTDDSIQPNDTVEWPGLAAVAQSLARLLLATTQQQDKPVRLYATASCMEIFAIVSPNSRKKREESERMYFVLYRVTHFIGVFVIVLCSIYVYC